MFGLSVNFLDGSSRRFKVPGDFIPADVSIASLRTQLEQSLELGSLHEVRLLLGDRELNDTDLIEVEIQAITTPSFGKAWNALRSNMSALAGEQIHGKCPQSWERVSAAMDILDIDEVPLPSDEMLERVVDLASDVALPIKLAHQFGRLVGRICVSEQNVASCCSFLKDEDTDALARAAALVEVAERGSLQLRSHIVTDSALSENFLDEFIHHQDEMCGLHELVCKYCTMLGHHGNASHIESLREIVLHESASYASAALAAMEQIFARAGIAPGQPDVSRAEAAAHGDVRAPTCMGKEEKVACENADIIQAYQNSKLDIPEEGVPLNSDGVVVLRLTRMARSPRLRNHLKTTSTLERARRFVIDAGCSLEPSWAAEAQLFVPLTHDQVVEAGLELSFDYVLLLISFYEDFKLALHEFNCQGKKRPKFAPLDRGEMFRAEVEGEGTVEVEPVSIMALRTDSSVGFPQNPHMSM